MLKLGGTSLKKYSLVVITIILAVSIMIGCAREPQVKMEKIEVAVVDQSKLWQESAKAKNYQQQLNEKIKVLKQEYNTDVKDLADSDQVAKQQEIYQEVNKLREELKQKFRQDIAQAVEKIAKKQGYDVVLNKDEVRFGGTDITTEVLNNL